MSKSFGQTIKDARNSRSLTQARVCEAVKEELMLRGVTDTILNQPTLSSWEGERQMPSGENIAVLQALEKVLKLKSTVIKGVLRDTGKRAGRAPDDEYADDLEEWLKTARGTQGSNTAKARIWFLAPNTLPAFLDTTNRLFELWKSNILHGVHYKMLWILEEVTDKQVFDTLDKTLGYLHGKIGANGKSDAELGKMEIYLVRRPKGIIRPPAATPIAEGNNESDFSKFEKEWSDRQTWISWSNLGYFFDEDSPDEIQKPGRKIYETIESVRSQLVGRLAIYLGADKPQANLMITDTSARFGGEIGRIYRWLGADNAVDLGILAKNVEAWIDSNRPPKD